MSSTTPIHEMQSNPCSSASGSSTADNLTSECSPGSPNASSNWSQDSNPVSINKEQFATTQINAQTQQTTTSGNVVDLTSITSPPDRQSATPTIEKIVDPSLRSLLESLAKVNVSELTLSSHREISHELNAFFLFSYIGDFPLPQGISSRVKELSLFIIPPCHNSLNPSWGSKTGFRWPLRDVTTVTADTEWSSFRALVLGRLEFAEDDHTQHYTHWIVVIATDYRQWSGNHLFALRASQIDKAEMGDEEDLKFSDGCFWYEDYEWYEDFDESYENLELHKPIRYKFSVLKNLFGPVFNGLIYHLGPLSILEAGASKGRKDSQTSIVSSGFQVNDQVQKAESLHNLAWISEDVVFE